MCILLVLLSIIPILCGYVVYLGIAALVTEASLALQITVGVIVSIVLFISLQQLWVFLVRRRR